MSYRSCWIWCFLCTVVPLAAWSDTAIAYAVEFEGIDDPTVLKSIKMASGLTTLKKHPPASLNALRYRAEADIPELIKVLHAYGYLEAQVTLHFEESFDQMRVTVAISPGPVYLVEEFTFNLYEGTPAHPIECPRVTLKQLGISLGKPARSMEITQAELQLMQRLAECGYPLAHIEQREIRADGDTKRVNINFDIQTGSLAHFGPLKISGIRRVKEELVRNKIPWKEGEVYDSRKVELAQNVLMDTGLFSSILIAHDKQPDAAGNLPMHLEATESKHRSVSAGLSYQTYYGPGITFGWENRNAQGLGRKVALQVDITKRSHSGIASYTLPDFGKVGQDYVWQAQAMHESITAYSERSYNLLTRLERKIGRRLRIAQALEGEKLFVTSSVDNGAFFLLELPFYLRWSSANSLLNPTRGASIEVYATPAVDLEQVSKRYLYQQIIQSIYLPLSRDDNVSLAQKITLGSILSPTLNDVPVPKRFLGGSEEDLRGYGYLTVSPLNSKNKPIGGRSALYYTLELRLRVTETIGFVPFFDLGNVYSQVFPTGRGKWLKSTGLGLRYFSFIGPFRFDIGFPLDRRKGLDPHYRIFVSIGQMF